VEQVLEVIVMVVTREPEAIEGTATRVTVEGHGGPAQEPATALVTAERNDGEMPAHMLRWAVVGVIVYIAMIAAGMAYAQFLTMAAR
jgi:hypothetical protein